MRYEGFAATQTAVLGRYGVTAKQRMVDAPVVGGQAHVLVAGAGPPVVLLNGIGVPAAMLAPLMAHIDGATLYAVDLPGFGLTDTTAGFANDLRANAVRFLIEVFDSLDLDRPVVVANSLGSLWASWLAIDRPDRITALVHLGCPAIVLDTSAPLPMRLLSARPLGRLMMKLQPPSERQVEQLAKMVHEYPLPIEIAELILATERLPHFEASFLSILHRLVRLRGSRSDMSLTAEDLALVKAPTLLVFATNDPMGAESVGRQMADIMVDTQLHIVDGGHAPWIHHGEQIGALVSSFIQRFDDPPGRLEP